jgi:hypothetical protein
MPPRIEWIEVVREFRERGLVVYGKRTFALDAAIDVESQAAREALFALLPLRDEPPGGYARIALSLYASGYDRAPLQERTEFDPRRAVLYARLETKVGEPDYDHDAVEALVEWPPHGPPILLRAVTRQGVATRERVRRGALGALRERLEAARARSPKEAVLTWVARGGAEVRFKVRQALGAVAEIVHRASPQQVERLREVADALERNPAAPIVLEDDRAPAHETPGWLGLLLGRRRTLGKSVISFRCPACGAGEEPGASLAERPYDRRGEFCGEAGIALVCPRGHEVARAAEREG